MSVSKVAESTPFHHLRQVEERFLCSKNNERQGMVIRIKPVLILAMLAYFLKLFLSKSSLRRQHRYRDIERAGHSTKTRTLPRLLLVSYEWPSDTMGCPLRTQMQIPGSGLCTQCFKRRCRSRLERSVSSMMNLVLTGFPSCPRWPAAGVHQLCRNSERIRGRDAALLYSTFFIDSWSQIPSGHTHGAPARCVYGRSGLIYWKLFK